MSDASPCICLFFAFFVDWPCGRALLCADGVRLPRPRRRARTARPPPRAVPSGSKIETPERIRNGGAAGRRAALLLATAGGAGYAPVAPGTFGSAVGLLLYLPLASVGPWLYALAVLGLLSLGIRAADECERLFGRKDDGRIVIDEVVGQLLALAPLVLMGRPPSGALLVTGFVAFRCFDIWKPGPVRWAERRFAGGLGVMMDDLVAGVLSAVVLAAAVAVLW